MRPIICLATSHIVKTFVLVWAFLSIGFASSAEEYGATGMWINDRKGPDEPLRTGMVWTNSPADKAGIKSGQFLIAVNGTNVVSKSVVEAMRMVRGPVGAVVTLELADTALTKTNKFTVKRGRAVIRNNQVVEIGE
jgi:carboxyl-terminal processing protease